MSCVKEGKKPGGAWQHAPGETDYFTESGAGAGDSAEG